MIYEMLTDGLPRKQDSLPNINRIGKENHGTL